MTTPQNTVDDPHATGTIVIGLVGTVMFLVVVLAGIALYQNVQYYEETRKIMSGGPPREFTDLRSEQLAQITTYRMIDAEAGTIAVPIDRAIELYAQNVESIEAQARIETNAAENPPAGASTEQP